MEATAGLTGRLTSEEWSMRANAFEDLTKIYQAGTGKEPEYAEYAG